MTTIYIECQRVSIDTTFNAELVEFFKTIPKYYFNWETKRWSFPYSALASIKNKLNNLYIDFTVQQAVPALILDRTLSTNELFYIQERSLSRDQKKLIAVDKEHDPISWCWIYTKESFAELNKIIDEGDLGVKTNWRDNKENISPKRKRNEPSHTERRIKKVLNNATNSNVKSA